ncbi:hypothetical protein [Ruegeria arenilitoris]|uniref:hypothetical protein n=1 Tax=Ruegeria arenilitoris TaxID=1173585 RepID=UPI0014816617|nr:hypothetical protein [Ruegeria arenilitoris]
MTKLYSSIENSPASQSLCELELWSPAQGSVETAVPISIDLDFDAEQIDFATVSFEVRARRATIHLSVVDAEVVRGSRIGEFVLDPHMVAEVTQCVRHAVEAETAAEGRIEVEVAPNFLGRLVGLVSWKKRKSKKAEHDYIVKSAMRVSRIIPRTAGKWSVVEPLNPHVLNGRLMGSDGEKEIGPLCLLTMRDEKCLVQVIVSVDRNDLSIKRTGAGIPVSRNKEAVISQLARRSIASSQVAEFSLPPNIRRSEVVLARSVMEVSIEEE